MLLIRNAALSGSEVGPNLHFTLQPSPSYSSTVGMNWSSHNEAFSSQLCSSGFQFHTQPSVSPLNGHHCPRHMQPRRILSTPPTCHTAQRHFSPSACVPQFCFCLPHTVTQTMTPLLWSCLCLCSYSPHLPALFWCFSCLPLVCVCVSPLVWWGNSGGSWHLAPLEMTHQTSQLINMFLFFFFSFSFLFLFLTVLPPSSQCEHSTSTSPPAAMVQPCPGGSWGPSGSHRVWDDSFQPPGSYIWPLRAISRGQPN